MYWILLAEFKAKYYWFRKNSEIRIPKVTNSQVYFLTGCKKLKNKVYNLPIFIYKVISYYFIF